MYQAYEEEDGDIPYDLFRAMIEEYNMAVMEEIIQGKTFEMGYGLASLSIIRIERDYSNPSVDWAATMQEKKRLLEEEGYTEDDLYSEDNPEGRKYFCYHTDPWYARFYWEKKNCIVTNHSAYSFRATRGDKGNKTKLKERLNNEETAHLDYKLISN